MKNNEHFKVLSEKEYKDREEENTKFLKKWRKKIFYYPICVLCPFAEDFSPSKKLVDCRGERVKSVGRCDTFDEMIKAKGISHPKFDEWKKHQLKLNNDMKGKLLLVSPEWKKILLTSEILTIRKLKKLDTSDWDFKK